MRKKDHLLQIWITLLALLLAVLVPQPVYAATLVVDGQFDDWAGQPYVTDNVGDGDTPNTDLLQFYWGTNPDEANIYFMFERAELPNPNAKVYYFIKLDINNNGSYNDPADRLISVAYSPTKNTGDVTVAVSTGTGQPVSQQSGDWGESADEGGRKAEWRVSFADLGIDVHQTISMIAGSSQNADASNMDTVPDSGSITWSPIPVLGWVWLAVIVVVVTGIAWKTRGRTLWQPPSASA